MGDLNRKEHWDNIYQTKELDSWHQPSPETSLELFSDLKVPLTAKIIDVGGGDSFLVDHLLDLGYTDVTVLDISANALEGAKKRLGDRAKSVKWIVADASNFKLTEQYDLWHDRAAFHFLTDENDITNYINIAQQNINPSGILAIGTFLKMGQLNAAE